MVYFFIGKVDGSLDVTQITLFLTLNMNMVLGEVPYCHWLLEFAVRNNFRRKLIYWVIPNKGNEIKKIYESLLNGIPAFIDFEQAFINPYGKI